MTSNLFSSYLLGLALNSAVRQERMSNSLLNRWTNLDLASCFAFKTTLFVDPLEEERLLNEFHPYFRPLIPLAKDGYAALKDNMAHPVTFDTFFTYSILILISFPMMRSSNPV